MSTLARLNDLRAIAGKAPLKAWKESKAKLADEIRKYEGIASIASNIALRKIEMNEPAEVVGDIPAVKVSELKPTSHPIAKSNSDSWNTVLPKRTVKRRTPGVKADIPEIDAKPKSMRQRINDGEVQTHPVIADMAATVTLVQIAAELGINPRVARAKMRRVKSLPAGTIVGKHTYAATHKQNVIDALKHDFRKK